MGVKIKHTDPTLNEFATDDLIVNVQSGSLFFKSNTKLFKLQGNDQSTTDTSDSLKITGNISSIGQYHIEIDSTGGNGGSGPRINMGLINDSDSFMTLGAFASKNNIDTTTRDFHLYGTNTTTGFYFDESAGNFGIGTSSPNAHLDIKGNFEGASNFAIKFTNTMGTGKVGGFRSHGTNGEALTLYQDGARKQSWQDDVVQFFGTSSAEVMRIQNNGNVGINTSNPTEKLQVEGNISASGNINGVTQPTKFNRAGINSSTYTMLCTVIGAGHASAIKMSIAGTSNSVVINVVFDILVNHSKDIMVKSFSGDYIEVTLRITSENNDDFSIEAKHNGTTTTQVEVIVFPLSNEIVTATTTDPGYSGEELEFTATEGYRFGGVDDGVQSGLAVFDSKVGIATTSPQAESGLTIKKTATIASSPVALSAARSASLLITSSGYQMAIDANELVVHNQSLFLSSQQDEYGGNIHLRTGDGDHGTTRMFISSSGNIGMGTNTPSKKLDVVGNAEINGSANITSTLTMGSYIAFPNVNWNDSSNILDASSNPTLNDTHILNSALSFPVTGDGITLDYGAKSSTGDNSFVQFRLRDNISGDSFRVYFDDYQGITYDKVPLEVFGNKVLLCQDNYGAVGIYTTTPFAPLTVRGDVTQSGGSSGGMDQVVIWSTTNAYGAGIGFCDQLSGSVVAGQTYANGQKGHLRFFHSDAANDTGTGCVFKLSHENATSLALDVEGNVVCATLTCTTFDGPSDINLKTNVNNIDTPLETILKLKGITFEWKEKVIEKEPGKRYTNLEGTKHGFIAQEVEKVLPDLINDEKPYKSLNYIEIIPILVEAMKEQQKQIDELKRKINE